MRSMLLLLLIAAPVRAQFMDAATRYELGLRLRLFERALEKHKGDKKAVARAVPLVAPATPAFFSGDSGKAARLLDTARLTLEKEKPDDAKAWASSFRFIPAKRVGDPKKGTVAVKIERMYKTKLAEPKEFGVACLIAGPKAATGTSFIGMRDNGTFSWEDMPEGDHRLLFSISSRDKVMFDAEQVFSHIDDLAGRLKKLEKADLGKTVEAATLAHHLGILKSLAKGDTLETDYPAHRLLVEAEAIAAGKWDNKKPGQYWLALPGVAGSPVRLAVPKEAKAGKPLPVVVALHGAGGSENMFFDGYGDGLVAKLALERGWFVVATRSGFFGGPDVPAVVDALAKIHPIDTKRVFIVGHSMGAAQTVSLAGRKPERYAAAAALGGGGGFKASDGLKKLPFYVGVGKLDFAARSAGSLAKSLEKAGAPTTFKEFDHVEHLAVVQLALPEVFAFFDKAGK